MVIIQMSGGLGNQMFEYALYLKLKSQGKKVKFDDQGYKEMNSRPIQLAVFGIDYPIASRKEVIELTDGSMNLRDRIRRKIVGSRSHIYVEQDGKSMNYDDTILRKNPAYFMGYFQSERYFKGADSQVKSAFTLKQDLIDENTKRIAQEIELCDASVGIHVRGGDYLTQTRTFGNICTREYYDKAIAYMLNKYPNAVFYLFTNDSEWSKQFSSDKEQLRIIEVEGNTEEKGYLDMYLMSKCKHNIIANSSFSWWAAYLNMNNDKTIIAPAKWLNIMDCSDIYTDEMVVIDAQGCVVRDIE